MSRVMRKHFAYAKTKAQIVQFLYFLNLKFPVSSHHLCLHMPVCVRTGQKPHCMCSGFSNGTIGR